MTHLFAFLNLSLFSVSSGSVVSGAGAFEVAVADALVKHKPNVKGRAQLGVQAFADALLVIPKVKNNSFSVIFINRNLVCFLLHYYLSPSYSPSCIKIY